MYTIYQQSNTTHQGQNNNNNAISSPTTSTTEEFETLLGLNNNPVVGTRRRLVGRGIQRKGGIVRCQGTMNLNLRKRLHSLGLDSIEAPVKPTIFQNNRKKNNSDTCATTNSSSSSSGSSGSSSRGTVSVPRGFIGRQISDITTISEGKEFICDDGLDFEEEEACCQIVRLEI